MALPTNQEIDELVRVTDKKPRGILAQVTILFVVCIFLTSFVTFTFEYFQSDTRVIKQTEEHADGLGGEVTAAIMEYPAHDWLLTYWHRHADTMNIEYDALYEDGTATEQKAVQLQKRYPDRQLKYFTEKDIKAMTEEDQKLYAEVAYTWLLTRVDQIKSTYDIMYLFCVMSQDPYEQQYFLFSAAAPGAKRGTAADEAYILGVTVSVQESQRDAMKYAVEHKDTHIANAGQVIDYYKYIGTVDGEDILMGMTYNVTSIKSEVEKSTRRGMIMAYLYEFILALLCLGAIWLLVIRPVKKVQANIRTYMDTKDSAAVVESLSEIRLENEIGQLSKDVSALTVEIDDYMDKITTISAEKKRIETELSLAKEIQAAMLPSTFPPFPERPEFDLYASMNPARDVGGDFYDFFLVDDDHLCLVIADVSGKGIPASLFMMSSKIILQTYAKSAGAGPAEILEHTNNTVCANNKVDMFVTVWLGILEISTGKVTAANAGHEYPVVRKADGNFELFKDKHGFVIGGMEGIPFKEYEFQLEPGSKIFVYTDGVPEATDANEEMFGTDRMLAALNQDPGATPEQLLENMRTAVADFVQEAEQFDDLTMLCMEYRGPGAKETDEEGAEDGNA